ncbi:unnamed protein product [Urochloa decumbens]|uniref:Uncharacterized protein n=1 Tax=Urochloa decumbens TaxID=240449 RepID=A0ABC9A290_9POAL
MVKAQVAARFTMEVAPRLVVSSTTRRRTAPARSLDPIAEDDREHLAYWSEYHQLQADDDDAATANSSSGFAEAWTKTKRAPPRATITGGGPMRDVGNGKHLPVDGHGQRGRRASIRKLQGHRRVV